MPKTNHANADLQDKGRAAFLSFCFKGRIESFNLFFLTKKNPFRSSQENFKALSPTNQERKRPKPALTDLAKNYVDIKKKKLSTLV